MKERRSNIEILRIASMAMIIAHHFAVHGGFYFQGPAVTGNMLLLQLMSIGGKVGVNLFVLITGYFSILSEDTRPRKLPAFWMRLFGYSTVLYAAACLTGLTEPSLRGAAEACFPVLSNQWWFASAWFFLMLLAPGMNPWLRSRSKKQYLTFLALFSALWYPVPVLTWLPGRLRELSWFVYLYCWAGFLRLHGRTGRGRLWLGLTIAAWLAAFCLGWLGMARRAAGGGVFETTYFDAHHILILAAGICLLRWGLTLELGIRPGINRAAGHVFGIYLIHDSNYLRYPLWQGLLKCAGWADSPWLVCYAAGCTAGVFLICLMLDALVPGRKPGPELLHKKP